MATPEPGAELRIEKYRDYLRLLAELHIDLRLRGKLDASDLVQETLLRAHQSRGQFVGADGAQLAAWLRQILVNTMIDAVRRFTAEGRDVALEQSIHRSVQGSSERLEAWLAGGSPPDEQAQRQEQLLHLAEALGRLPEDERVALQLKHLEGWSVQEIGRHLDRSNAGVAGLLRRGLKRLRATLNKSSDICS